MPDKAFTPYWQVAANLTDDAPASLLSAPQFIIRGDGGAVAENLLQFME